MLPPACQVLGDVVSDASKDIPFAQMGKVPLHLAEPGRHEGFAQDLPETIGQMVALLHAPGSAAGLNQVGVGCLIVLPLTGERHEETRSADGDKLGYG